MNHSYRGRCCTHVHIAMFPHFKRSALAQTSCCPSVSRPHSSFSQPDYCNWTQCILARCNFCSASSFSTGFEVFCLLMVAINHPTTPPPHVMLHQPRFWSLCVLGRRREEGALQHLLDRSSGKGINKGERIIYFHSSHPPPFSYSSFLYILLYKLFFFKIRRLSVSVVCDKQKKAQTLVSSNCIYTLYVRTTITTFPRTGRHRLMSEM